MSISRFISNLIKKESKTKRRKDGKRSHRIEACRDPDDNKFIECAIDNRCIYIVSGDKDLLVLEQYEDIGILTVSDFLEQYEKKRHKNSTKN